MTFGFFFYSNFFPVFVSFSFSFFFHCNASLFNAVYPFFVKKRKKEKHFYITPCFSFSDFFCQCTKNLLLIFFRPCRYFFLAHQGVFFIAPNRFLIQTPSDRNHAELRFLLFPLLLLFCGHAKCLQVDCVKPSRVPCPNMKNM